jgi:DNA polymerase I-like protein with 3'-5' exonuclease and polymerase domains
MKTPRVFTIDFETYGIQRRPEYPPKPVGVSIMKPGQKKSRYYAFAHPEQNNCGIAEAKAALQEAWDSKGGLLFHNGKFDLDVAMTHFGLPMPAWSRIQETMFLLFLNNPYSVDLKLKPASERLLGMRPEERDVVKEWVLDNVPEMQRGYPWPKTNHWGRKFKKPEWGAYICRAPGAMVGKYADGDVTRTKALYDKLWPEIQARGMGPAYDTERELMPILLENERAGVRLDLPAARKAHADLKRGIEVCDAWLRKALKAPDLEVENDQQLVAALEKADAVTFWTYTKPTKTHPQGQKSVSKDNLPPSCFKDQKIARTLGYRNRAQTLMAVFLEHWIDMAEATGGWIHTSWNQVKGAGAFGDAGAGTGRMSSAPNFQNIPQEWEDETSKNPDRYVHPSHLRSLVRLPLARALLLPDEGTVWLKRDYSQQEYRALAHFEDGRLSEEYRANEKADIHVFVHGQILEITGMDLPRKTVKTTDFGMLYGMGITKLAQKLGISVEEAKRIKKAWQKALPDVVSLDEEIKHLMKIGGLIRTWGGREYPVKPPVEKKDEGRWQTFEYKSLNDLIQGSSADCTKRAMIAWYKAKKSARFLIQVHDELNICAPAKDAAREMTILKDAMDSVGVKFGEEPSDDGRFRVPMSSEGAKSETNWAEIEKWEP